MPMDEEEEKFSNSEYTKVVLKALKEAISENEKAQCFLFPLKYHREPLLPFITRSS